MIDEFEKDIVHITIYGAHAKLTGDAPWAEVYDATSFAVEGAQYSKAFRRGVWNGRTYLCNKKTGSFPAGLTEIVKEVCELEGKKVYVHDQRIDPGSLSVFSRGTLDLVKYKMEGKYQYQMDTCLTAINKGRGIIKACTGSGKTSIIAGLISYYQLPALLVVPSLELLDQTRNVLLAQIPDVTEADIGRIGDGEWTVGKLATVATCDTLVSRFSSKECQELLKKVDLLIADEVHYAGSDTWYDVLLSCDAYYRFGMSGTPVDRTDGANLKIYALFGDIIVDIRTKQLVDLGVLPDAKIIFDKITKPVITGKVAYAGAYKQGVVENKYLTERVIEWTELCTELGLSVLILVDEIKHGRIIDDALWNVKGRIIPHTFINGQSSEKSNRKEGFEAFHTREIPVLIASDILSTGVSTDAIDVLIPVGSRKSKIKTVQRLGRTLRGDKAIVIEIANYCHKYLLEHSLTRYRDYKAEDCFEIVKSAPNKELLKNLWDKQKGTKKS